MGAAVGLAGAHPEDTAQAARVDHLASLDHGGREHLGLGVAVERARAAGGVEHGPGFLRVSRERLGADLVAPCLRELQGSG